MISEFISTFPTDQVAIININTVLKALSVREQYKYSFWDSLIIATAIQSQCNILYSEDLNTGQVIENCSIVNPFI